MRVLLDSCTFLWLAAEPERLSAEARGAFEDQGNEVYLSCISAWELAVKHALGKLAFPDLPRTYVPALRRRLGVASLGLDEEASLHVALLPELHRDPFDRMLVAQAIVHGMTLLTPDRAIARYPARTLW